MKTKFILGLALATLQIDLLYSQEKGYCGSTEANRELMLRDPSFKKRIEDFDKELSRRIKSGEISKKIQEYEIPVVVHVIEYGPALGTVDNPTDAQIINWIDVLNKVYAIEPGFSGPNAVKIPIKYVLAKRGPDCNATTGIVRYDASANAQYVQYGINNNSGTNGVLESVVKSWSRWDPKYYYNMYLVKSFTNGVAGYAYFAGTGPASDGTFMVMAAVTDAGESKRILPHEIGHSLGLYHTFEGGDPVGGTCATTTTGDCTQDNDKVCDTEVHQSNLYGSSPSSSLCSNPGSVINPCTTVPYQGVQYNVMNYGYCNQPVFTTGQKDRAIAQLLQFRQSLVNSKGAMAPDINLTVVPSCAPASILNPNNGFGIGIKRIKFGSIDNSSEPYSATNGFYNDYTLDYCRTKSVFTDLTVGTSYAVDIQVGANPTRVKAYIDYNNNGIFDSTEVILSSSSVASGTTATFNFVPPATAVLNTPLRMRVIGDFSSTPEIQPCTSRTYGEAEDYMVRILPAVTLGTGNSIKNNEIVEVYPNPIADKLTVTAHENIIQKIEIIDVAGRLVKTISSKSSKEIIDTHLLQQGNYILKVTTDKGVFNKKLIKK